MSGLLDKKTRILDFIITDVGKQELTKGELSFDYVTFNDLNAQYSKDPDFDHTELLTFEASSIPSDLFIHDLENNGKLLTTNMSNGAPENVVAGVIADAGANPTQVSINNFNNFVKNTIIPLSNQSIITNVQQFADRDEFLLSPKSITFGVADNTPIAIGQSHVKNINALPNIFQDKDFKTKQNFKFLPPINSNLTPIFEFDDFDTKDYPKTVDDVINEFKGNEQNVEVQFQETSEKNNIILQFFEKNTSELQKLHIIAHESEDGDDSKNAYFIGKLFTDNSGVKSFIKIFTLIIFK